MSTGRRRPFQQEIDRLWSAGTASGLDDAELLRRFNGARGEAAEQAFEVLLDRHGPMVLSVCRGILRRPQDADDAFQATFLILVRKASKLRLSGSLAPWLYAVSCRTALRARAQGAKVRSNEHWEIADISEPTADAQAREIPRLLHQELAGLPEKYRAPIVLCHLEGKSHEEAARILKWPVGTLSGRLSRGRQALKVRLERRGLGSLGILAPFAVGEPPLLDAKLCAETIRMALQHASSVPLCIKSLTPGALNVMIHARVTRMLVALVMLSGASAAFNLRSFWLPSVLGQNALSPGPGVPGTPPSAESTVHQAGVEGRAGAGGAMGMMMGDAGMMKPMPENSAMGGMMAGMMGMMAGPASEPLKNSPNLASAAEQAPLYRIGRIVLAETADGKSLVAMNTQSEDLDWIRYDLPAGVSITPIVNAEVATFAAKGDLVSEVAAFSAMTGTWVRQKLLSPIKEQIAPAVGQGTVLFQEGNNFYAFSARAGKWDTLRLDGPEKPHASLNPSDITVQQGNRVYLFSPDGGRWSKGIALKAAAADNVPAPSGAMMGGRGMMGGYGSMMPGVGTPKAPRK